MNKKMIGLEISLTLLLVSCSSISNVISNSSSQNLSNQESSSEITVLPSISESEETLSSYEQENAPSEDIISIDLSKQSGNVLIEKEGSYLLTGSLIGQVFVNVDGQVHLFLNNVNITSLNSGALVIFGKKKKVITLMEGSVNTLEDGSTYSQFYNDDQDEPNGTLFCKKALTINGNGTLKIKAQGSFITSEETKYAQGIICKDNLNILDNPIIEINSIGNGIKGKDSLHIYGGTFEISAGNDALKSDNEEDEGLGNIIIHQGNFNITSGDNAITAYRDLLIEDGNFHLVTGGGNQSAAKRSQYTNSYHAIKNDIGILELDGGQFYIDSLHDAIHSNHIVQIKGATIECYTSDALNESNDGKTYIHGHGVHADDIFYMLDGTLHILSSYEGVEAEKIYVIGGEISLVSKDDGFNASSDTNDSSNCLLQFEGGTTYVNASGDGLDSNGNILIKGGTIIVDGPTSSGDGALDCGDRNNTILIEGGTLVALGATGMAENPSFSSTQVFSSFTLSNLTKDLEITFKQDQTEIFKFNILKSHTGTTSIVVSFTNMENNVTYSCSYSGTSTSFIGGTTVSNNMGGGGIGGGGSRPGGGGWPHK